MPLAECFLLEGWEEFRLATILIARKHINGNRTYAIFSVDLNCLGIRDVDYEFNVAESVFEETAAEFMENGYQPCQYNLAHNIIYGALEFAENYGFRPAKGWEVARYILEEDDDEIPLIEVEFGTDGQPCYIAGSNDSLARQNQIIKTLEKTAGPGNYTFIQYREDYDQEDDIANDESDAQAEPALSPFAPGELEDIISGKKVATLRQMLLLLTARYINDHEENLFDLPSANKALILENYRFISPVKREKEIVERASGLEGLSLKKQLTRLNELRVEFGDNPILLYLIYLTKMEEQTIPDDIVRILDEQYPDFLEFRFFHAYLLAIRGYADEARQRLGSGSTLEESFPYRHRRFTTAEFTAYHVAMCHYHIEKGELGKAIPYAFEVADDDIDDDNYPGNIVAIRLCEALGEDAGLSKDE